MRQNRKTAGHGMVARHTSIHLNLNVKLRNVAALCSHPVYRKEEQLIRVRRVM
jgi:hypothetical protein